MWPANSATANRMMFLRFIATRSVAARGDELVPNDLVAGGIALGTRAAGGELPALASRRYLFRHHDVGEPRSAAAARVDEHEVLHRLGAAARAIACAPAQIDVGRPRWSGRDADVRRGVNGSAGHPETDGRRLCAGAACEHENYRYCNNEYCTHSYPFTHISTSF